MKKLIADKAPAVAVAFVAVGFLATSYAAGQTRAADPTLRAGELVDLSEAFDPVDPGLQEAANEVTRVVREMVREAEAKRVRSPGGGGDVTFPGAF